MQKQVHSRGIGSRKDSSTTQPKLQPSKGVFGTLIPEIQRALAAEGYTTPTPIQEQCIPHLLKGRDLLGTAQTGTGKTAAFALPLLQRLNSNYRRPQLRTPRALILTPTRELAAQIGESINTYGRFLNLRHTVIYGGVKQFHQVKAMNKGIDILVATPGRLLDLMQQGFIHLNEVEVFILDEGDRMLDMGFIPDIKRVLSHVPDDRQTLLFSATMAPKIVELARTMVRNPVRITITPDQPVVENITQKVLFVGKKNKDALLLSLLSDPSIYKALIFTQMKHTANKVVAKLSATGVKSTAIHGNKSQAGRIRALDGFKQGRFRVLVATDVAARGLDVDDITHVINYDLPIESETYVHRIGRTARAGENGDAISFCCAEDRAYLRGIEHLLGKPLPTEMEHAYHCHEAFRSNLPAPKNFGRGNGNRTSRSKGTRSRSRGYSRGKR
ncbi:MAG: DEAD/DEAH box helicase [Candidatus Aegiribacteria sp.]|nr:DEAD/DEAH box helicase [Candidatus Aegiribacteria sp.]